MRRLALLPLLLVTLACPKDKRPGAGDTVAVAPPLVADTVATDLSAVQSALPPADPDTFKVRTPPAAPKPRAAESSGSYPAAPAALMTAVQREQSFSKFCYQEFGQKSDPSLAGGVVMLVTVAGSGITDARVANDRWSSRSGKAVNECLNEKAKLAWKVAPGDVKPGKYYVQLAFTGG